MKKNIIGIIFDILKSITGIVSVILGFVCIGISDGTTEMSATYGGDAYTGIQNAAAVTANNVWHLSQIVIFGFASILIIAGLVIIFSSLKRLTIALVEFSQTKKESLAQQGQPAPVTGYQQPPVQQSPVASVPPAATPAATPVAPPVSNTNSAE